MDTLIILEVENGESQERHASNRSLEWIFTFLWAQRQGKLQTAEAGFMVTLYTGVVMKVSSSALSQDI